MGPIVTDKANLWGRITSLLFQEKCLGCRRVIPYRTVLCDDCKPALPKEPLHRRYILASGYELKCTTPVAYGDGYRISIHRFKFYGKWDLARGFSALMNCAFPRDEIFDSITSVPMRTQSIRKRGYNQSALLAQSLSKLVDLPYREMLEKVKKNAVQHDLSAEDRIKNVQGVYRVMGEAEGKRILLIDDIITTGNTLKACANKLYEAGAEHVECMCIADADNANTIDGEIDLESFYTFRTTDRD